jgi:multidrug efflux pump subunit AcrA (membrane-fusion protein)
MFLAFGTIVMAYGAFMIVLVLLFVKNIFVSQFGDWGYPALGLGLFLLLRSRVQKAMPQIRAWYWKLREAFVKWNITRAQQVAVASIALVLFVPPFSGKVSSEFILEPALRMEIRPPADGQLVEIRVRNGEAVRAGDVLAYLSNPELEAQAAQLSSELAAAESAFRIAEQRGTLGDMGRATEKRQRAATELSVTRTLLAGLTIRAPMTGTIVTGEFEPHPGDFVGQGQDFIRVVDRTSMHARILVHDWELSDVVIGAPVQLKIAAYPLRTYRGSIERILPAAAADLPVSQISKVERHGQELTNYFAVEMSFLNFDGSLMEGMTGTAKITGKHRPYAWQIAESAWRWLRSQIW